MLAMPRDATTVVHITGSPRTIQALAAEAASREVGVINAPVSGGPHDIAAGRGTLLDGGADDDVERARPVLAAYGDPVLHVGPLGAGRPSSWSTTRCSPPTAGCSRRRCGPARAWASKRPSC
jgi:3-hydroxyisobutyrate dehydrogenase-like beta-hydroxyacid dehydrogenase